MSLQKYFAKVLRNIKSNFSTLKITKFCKKRNKTDKRKKKTTLKSN